MTMESWNFILRRPHNNNRVDDDQQQTANEDFWNVPSSVDKNFKTHKKNYISCEKLKNRKTMKITSVDGHIEEVQIYDENTLTRYLTFQP